MPYVIDRPTKRRRALAVASVAMLTWLGAAGLAAAPALADTSSCTDPVLTQPFTAFNDQNYYMLVPGESDDNFDGGGWTLTGGASITTTTLADGSTGSVLDLPSGATAISPDVCVNSNYPTARTMVNDVAGLGAVLFSVSYQGTDTGPGPQSTDGPPQGPGPGPGPAPARGPGPAGPPPPGPGPAGPPPPGHGLGVPWLTSTGLGTGWSLSRTALLHAPNVASWETARFRFTSVGSQDSDFQLYDFYVDPYSRG